MRSRSPRVVVPVIRRKSVDDDYANSRDKSWDLPVISEQDLTRLIKQEWRKISAEAPKYDGYISTKKVLIVDLDDFEIYVSPHQARAYELSSLEFQDARGRQLWFDGKVSLGSVKQYVQGAEIKSVSIEGYGTDDDASTTIHIQTQVGHNDQHNDIWYRLRVPGARYREYHELFQWVADLGKHVMDFLELRRTSVGLNVFRSDFHRWLVQRFPDNVRLKKWLKSYGCFDFRKAIHAHIDYLAQEAYNLPEQKSLLNHTFWGDCMRENHQSIKPQPMVCTNTIATPHVFNTFKRRYFAEKLQEWQPAKAIYDAMERRKRELGFPTGLTRTKRPKMRRLSNENSFSVGDVVGIVPDDSERRLWWKTTADAKDTELWYAYVQRAEPMAEEDVHRLYVIWMYRPENTSINTTDYPVKNELFMSDHCNCDEGFLLSTDVVRRCTVEHFAKGFKTSKDFIVRQKFVTKDASFVTLKGTDFVCDCGRETLKTRDLKEIQDGDTVYITKTRQGIKFLDPVVIHKTYDDQEVTVRQLLRLKDHQQLLGHDKRSQVAPNELVWTSDFIRIRIDRIKRRCHVKYFTKEALSQVPFPYHRDGAGDFWILSTVQNDTRSKITYLTGPPSSLNQGPDLPSLEPFDKLKGLSLFSGLGNLDKGLEEAGAVEFNASVDLCAEAIHTLHANAKHPEKLQLWLGSVDDYLQAALDGKKLGSVVQIGDVDVIAAGSPCPGFSKLQQDWLSDQSLRNASHVTIFCSFVDLYRPKYAFLENVVNMASARVGYESELVLSQVVACLVAMGYQVQHFIMNATSYGSCQRRERLILSIAAPGLTPITPPALTHSNPVGMRLKSIGTLMSGQKYGVQFDCPTPFPHATASQMMGHLPNIGSGSLQGCISSPDHRLYTFTNELYRQRIQCIPFDPPGQGLQEALTKGLIPKHLQQQGRKELGTAYRRLHPNGVVPTLTTTPSPNDSRNGGFLHWNQHRLISIEEARIIQGIPSEEVIIGPPREQMKMLGNAVDRHVSVALGLALRTAVGSNLRFENSSSAAFAKFGGYSITEVYEEECIVNKEKALSESDSSTLSVIHVNTPGQYVEHRTESLKEEFVNTLPGPKPRPRPESQLDITKTPTKSVLNQISQTLAVGANALQSFSPPKHPSIVKKRARDAEDEAQSKDPRDNQDYFKRARQIAKMQPLVFPRRARKLRKTSPSNEPVDRPLKSVEVTRRKDNGDAVTSQKLNATTPRRIYNRKSRLLVYDALVKNSGSTRIPGLKGRHSFGNDVPVEDCISYKQTSVFKRVNGNSLHMLEFFQEDEVTLSSLATTTTNELPRSFPRRAPSTSSSQSTKAPKKSRAIPIPRSTTATSPTAQSERKNPSIKPLVFPHRTPTASPAPPSPTRKQSKSAQDSKHKRAQVGSHSSSVYPDERPGS